MLCFASPVLNRDAEAPVFGSIVIAGVEIVEDGGGAREVVMQILYGHAVVDGLFDFIPDIVANLLVTFGRVLFVEMK